MKKKHSPLMQNIMDFSYLFPDGNFPKLTRDVWSGVAGENYSEQFINIVSDEAYLGLAAKLFLNVDLFPFQLTILRTLWTKRLPLFVACRGGGKSWLLAVFACLKAILNQGTKIIIVGPSFRQSKVVFNYIDEIWKKSSVLQSMTGTGKRAGPKMDVDQYSIMIGDSKILAIPLGDGSKIRGLRGNIIIVDEYAMVPESILNVVVKGFGVVSRDPVAKVKEKALINLLKKQNMFDDEIKQIVTSSSQMNQIIYSGTAYYEFNHFFRDFMIWKAIIVSKGDTEVLNRKMDELREKYGYEYDPPETLSWKDYAIIRLPYDGIPSGFMEEEYVDSLRASMHTAQYQMEYCTIFLKDSKGFYRRSLIKSVTAESSSPVILPSGEDIVYTPLLLGIHDYQYVMGVDPAKETDNFAIVILELHHNHRRIVYCWATNMKDFTRRRKAGQAKENEYYSFCAHKIRDLTKLFNIVRIEMDAFGGGTAIGGCLMNKDLLADKEIPIYEILEDKDKPTDHEQGAHILHYVKANSEWNSNSNHGMKADFENKRLLFPMFDTVSVPVAKVEDEERQMTFDNTEENLLNIEDLKNELTNIILTGTPTGKEQFNTPEKRELIPDSGKKSVTRLRKDRFSALLMANAYATLVELEEMADKFSQYQNIGAIEFDATVKNKELYTGLGKMKNAEQWW